MPRALAIAAHPDDIEFMMAGTLLLLRDAGWDIHCMNISSGNLGSLTMSPAKIARIRRAEAQASAAVMQAVWHAPICNDLQVFYDDRTLRRVAAVVREVNPSIVLTHSPQDYMEDHMNTARLAVTATFARSVPGYRTVPPRRDVSTSLAVYHGMPHGLCDSLRRPVIPEAFVNTADVQDRKREALECHESQRGWLSATQAMDSYIVTMEDFARTLGSMSKKFTFAEGWRRHLHYGFGDVDADPLRDALKDRYSLNPAYQRLLDGSL
ncbi:MAG TPA: PIG-L family deacetylase [Vicinamibacterales bacterium]|nr:PIG-L family deacetylase [Vicinamibacterales bacterium]